MKKRPLIFNQPKLCGYIWEFDRQVHCLHVLTSFTSVSLILNYMYFMTINNFEFWEVFGSALLEVVIKDLWISCPFVEGC